MTVKQPHTLLDPDSRLAEEMGEYFTDPMGWVMFAFPWDEDTSIQIVDWESETKFVNPVTGEVFNERPAPPINAVTYKDLMQPYREKYGVRYGPDYWACQFLESWGRDIEARGFDPDNPLPVDAIQKAVASGHGIGKSTLSAWIILFIMSTRPFCKGTVTANTSEQLQAKTWAELGKWWKKCITKEWFEYTSGRANMLLYHKRWKESWRCQGQTCREENSESFAGQHAANSTSFYLFDEASAVADVIWDVAEGGLTDGEPMWFVFGNPTRNTGRFSKCFKELRHRWDNIRIDSRRVAITNKAKIAQWVADYGEDSDFVKVRVRGDFPSVGDMQFIGETEVDDAIRRAPQSGLHNPLIMGVDVAAAEHADQFVLYFRKGQDGKTIPPLKFRNTGVDKMFTMTICGHIAEHARGSNHTHREAVDAIFVDCGGPGWPIIHELRRLGLNPIPVDFGGASSEPQYANKSAQMWGNMRDWLREGGSLADDKELRDDLTGRMYGYNKNNQYVMESKKDMRERGLPSPDVADGLALTFAYPVAPKNSTPLGTTQAQADFDPFA